MTTPFTQIDTTFSTDLLKQNTLTLDGVVFYVQNSTSSVRSVAVAEMTKAQDTISAVAQLLKDFRDGKLVYAG